MDNNKPWLQNYDKGVPATLQPYLNRTLIDVMRETAGLRPNHPALLFKGTKISYSELDRLSDAFAQALIAQGIKKGDRVAIVMPNIPQFVTHCCLLYTSPSPRDGLLSRMPSSA